MNLILPLVAATLATTPMVSDASHVYPFDTESCLNDWLARERHWHIAAGELIHEDPFSHGGALSLDGFYADRTRFEADIRIHKVYHEANSVWAGLLIRAPDPLAHGAWRNGYHFFIRANGIVVLHAQGDGVLQTVQTELRPREDFVRLTLDAQGDRLRCYANGALLFDLQNASCKAGSIALVHFGNTAAFRRVHVAGNAVEPEPPAPVHPDHPAPPAQPEITPLSPIGIRYSDTGAGEFFNRETGERFLPNGFNHTVLEPGGWHATFNTNRYDADAMEKTLTAMRKAGGNTIRVWAWGAQNAFGFTGPPTSRGLNGAYMENFLDFLRRATRHGIYVLPILDETPHNAYYTSLSKRAEAASDTRSITGYNRGYLSPGPLAAKAAAAADFARYVRQADPALLHTVLGWSFANEIFVNHTQGPFSRDKGVAVTSTANRYDMADNMQRQACYDTTILHWANTLARALKSEVPHALVTAGMWTSDAHGRQPVNYLLPDDKDPRVPPRPSVLGGPDSHLDFLDIHIYPWDGTAKVRPEAHEWDAVRAGGKPVLVGEYGVFKNKTSEEAREIMASMLTQAYAMDYQGALHWVWDLTHIEGQTWSSVEEGLAEYLMNLDLYPKP